MNTPKDCGLLNRVDARAWRRWWSSRGHTASLCAVGRGLYRCTLTLERTAEPVCTRCNLANNSWGPGAPPACNDELPHTWETL
jgi:hypothetical protein